MLNKIRHWLIRLLARGDSIVLNTHFVLEKDRQVCFKQGKGVLVVRNCFFDSSGPGNE